MKPRICLSIGVALMAITSSQASADRCIGPKDNDVAQTYGVPAINAADITWCDDFDSYCTANCGACDTGDPTSIWPGFPPTPDNLCASPTDVSETFFGKPYHWPNATVSNPLGLSSSAASSGPWQWLGWDNAEGWTTGPYTLLYKGNRETNQYHTFNLVPAIADRFPGMNLLNGSNENPLTLRFWMNAAEIPHPEWGYLEVPANLAMYVELRKEEDHAPTNYVMRNCYPEGQGPYPMVCQQRNVPAGCPTPSTTVHSSLAFGWLSLLDTNPCDVENGRKPTNYHSAVFDGTRWTQMLNSMFAGQVGGFNWDYGQAYFEMKIMTNVMEIKQFSYKDVGGQTWQLYTSTATIPRQYLGAFNRMSIGVAPGCELNANGTCAGDPDVWRYMKNAPPSQNWGWSDNYVDRVALLGGIGDAAERACCMPDRACTVATGAACVQAGGVPVENQTACIPGVCVDVVCPKPFADEDWDKDVDMDDFAALQRCLTPTSSIATGCKCFDKNADGAIDAVDVERFVYCTSGKEVAWAATSNCP